MNSENDIKYQHYPVEIIRASILNTIEHTYGNIRLRRLAWDTALKLHIPAYIVFRVCLDLIESNELKEIDHKIVGKAATPHHKLLENIKINSIIDNVASQLSTDKYKNKWDQFRDLVSYYIKCIHLEEGSTAKVWQDTLGEQFIYLSEVSKWYPRDNVLWKKTIPYSDISGTIRDLWRNSDSTTLILGYPVYASVTRNGDMLLFPIFCYVLDHRFSSSGLELKTRLTRPFVNTDWLDRAFSKSSEKRTFLEATGIYAEQDEDNYDGWNGSSPDFLVLAQILASAQQRRIREPLNPCCLSGKPIDPSSPGGIYNRAVIVASRSSPYSKSLITELETIARAPDAVLDKTALAYLFADAAAGDKLCKPASGAIASNRDLTGTQRRAAASLMDDSLTVIQGPPGTGKSQVLSSAVLNARIRGKSVLISSYNHKAIDAVMERLEPASGKPLVKRCNAKNDPNLSFGMLDAINNMLIMPCGEDSNKESIEAFLCLLKKRGEKSLEADNVESCGKELAELGEILEARLQAFPWLSDKDIADLKIYGAAAKLSRECGSQTPFKTFFLRGNFSALFCQWRAASKLRQRGAPIPKYSLTASMIPFAETFETASNLLEVIRSIQEKEAELKKMPLLEDLCKEVADLDSIIKKQIATVMEHESQRCERFPEGEDKSQLIRLKQVISAVRSALNSADVLKLLHEDLPEKLKIVLRCFPCWAVTSLSVKRYIPLVPGLFDLVLIDEASQSNVPSAIPLLFRAKRAGIIGDPWQLRFVSRMTADREALLQRELNFSSIADLKYAYADNSLYDLASGSPAASHFFLDCTFRSASDIAEYSNKLFYSGRLQVGTDESRLCRPAGMPHSMEWCEIQGKIERGSGQRSCWCHEEVEKIIKIVKHLLTTINFKGSIGIVTPFKEQALRIEDSLEISGIDQSALRDAKVHTDTAHGFQGDERDVMILSLCAGNDLPPGSLHFLKENPNIFNVAVSRARSTLYLVGNREWAKNCGIRHIEALALPAKVHQTSLQKSKWSPYESPYEKMLAEALQKAGLDPLPQVPVGYRRLDLALRDPAFPECRLDIEVDGSCHRDAGGHRKSDDLWRTLELEAAGWKVIRFWTYQLREDLPACVARVQEVWNTMRGQLLAEAEE